ncbi:MAG: geranylgeranylglyceryl/heptaprenylglyceryl phosphate synthase, partial [Candidatus Odinarchaeia archaeon]
IAAAYALAAQYLGFKLVYLEAGSGASEAVPLETVAAVTKTVELPVIVGGGIDTAERAVRLVEAGVKMIVQGTFIERTVLKDKGEKLKEIIRAIKEKGREVAKNKA